MTVEELIEKLQECDSPHLNVFFEVDFDTHIPIKSAYISTIPPPQRWLDGEMVKDEGTYIVAVSKDP